MIKKIFISYRRSDTFDISRRLASTLRTEFGDESVYFDETSAPPGTLWPASIRSSVESAHLFMPVIGQSWLLTHEEKSGRRRIDLPYDWVRLEILTFLNRAHENQELSILPVLVNGATLDIADYLDEQLRAVCEYQPVRVHDTGDLTDFGRVKQRLSQLGFRRIAPPVVNTPMMGRLPVQLSRKDENDFLASYPDWRIIEHEKPGVSDDTVRELYRVYEFKSYDAAWQFMTQVNELGIRPYNHHPRWQNNYNRVEVWLCTSNIGHKPSSRDIRLAGILEDVWRTFLKASHTAV